jgi:hypothetical protein
MFSLVLKKRIWSTVCCAVFFFFSLSLAAQTKGSEDILRKISEDVYILNDMTIDVSEGQIKVPCRINMDEGLLEVILCRREGKVHESLLVTDVSPLEFQTALLLLGLDPVNKLPEDTSEIDHTSPYKTIETEGDSTKMFLSYEVDGRQLIKPLESFVFDESVNKELKPSTWLFRGAVTHQSGHVIVDPETTMIATYHDPVALMELNAKSKFNDELFYVNKSAKLTIGMGVTLIIQKI